MAICGVIFAACADYLGYLFTDDEEVVRAVAEIAYIAALFQLADGGQARQRVRPSRPIILVHASVPPRPIIFVHASPSANHFSF